MEPFVARALMNRLLSEDERKSLKAIDDKLQESQTTRGKYLQGFEICQKFRLKPNPIPDDDIDRMSKLHWIWTQEWVKKYDELRESSTESFNVNSDHWLGDLRDWEVYAEQNYQPVLPQYPSMVCLAVMLLPLMFK